MNCQAEGRPRRFAVAPTGSTSATRSRRGAARSLFFPVRCKSLASPPASCYHWPMSRRASNSRFPSKAIPPEWPQILRNEGQPLASRTQFPKWNWRFALRPNSRAVAVPLCATVEPAPAVFAGHKLPCQPTRRPTTAVDRSLRSAARKLEFHPTRFFSAASKFLIDNFERFVSSEFASHSTLATSHFFSNRHTYEKLELAVNALASTISIFLIDTKTHWQVSLDNK